jgi:putative ABC transport system permease protein
MLWQDVRYGLRMLARNPGFTAVVIVVLAIGIGATTVMLSVLDAVLLRPCPYRDPDSLVCVYETDRQTRTQITSTSLAALQDWQERNHVFEHLIGAAQLDCLVRLGDRTEKTRALYVSPGFFSVLGAQPVLGRAFAAEEQTQAGEPVAILSHTHWQHWFGGDPNVVGRTMTVDKKLYTVVGVLSPEFRWTFQSYVACGLWMPLARHPDHGTSRDVKDLFPVIGRLKPGIPLSQAQAEMDLITAQLVRQYPKTTEPVVVVPLREDVATTVMGAGKPRTLVMALGIAASVLLIACLHVASLLIARSATRQQEIAVRATLGASRLRLVRQLLIESVLLAGFGGLVGCLFAYWGIQILSVVRGRSMPWYVGAGSRGAIPWFVQVQMDGRILLYAAGISLLTCGLFGVLPAIGASAVNLSRSLSTARTPAAGPRFQRLRGLLVVGDIAMAFLLLIGAGLMVNSYSHIANIDFGYDPKNVLTAHVPLHNLPGYSAPERQLAFIEEVMDRVRALPGVRSVTTGPSPVGGTGNHWAFKIEGAFSDEARYRNPGMDDRLPNRSYMWFPFWWVSPGYFRVLEMPLLKGRYFTEQDTGASQPVAIISAAMAQRFWPNGNPVGRYITQAPLDSKSAPTPRQVVGVVATATHLGRSEPTDQAVYVPESQAGAPFGEMELLIRADPGHREIAGAVRRGILAVDRDVLIRKLKLLDEEIAEFFAPQRLSLLLLGGFAVVGLALACLGVYGTTAYVVSRRTREIGIRMALGARSADVLGAVLRRGLKLTLIGLAIGLAGALAATRIIRSLLYDVSPTDPLTFACVSLLLAGVALLACYLPARRAARIDPMTALRCE